MLTTTQPGEYVKCSFCGGDEWQRTMVETVKIKGEADDMMVDYLVGGDSSATFVCASCGKDKIEE